MHQSGWTYLLVLGAIVAIAVIVWLLGKLFPDKSRTAAGNALMQAEVFFNPASEHVIEAKQHEEREDENSGDPPEAGAN